ncbi:MAG TPA: SDR family oxidoreductase [Dehalococcoidia bacterium]|nr:SDR family oxidoreductase [Dehalococcoidia bacterium]
MGDMLKGKVAVVTGSGQGIGRSIAIGLAEGGARVVTNNRAQNSQTRALIEETQLELLDARKRETFEKRVEAIGGDAGMTAMIIKERGGEATPFYGDISRFNVAEQLIKTAVDTYGTIDILVNVAGSFGLSRIDKMTEELWDRVNTVKPKGYFNTIRHAVPYMMEKKWGRILNCTSKAWLGDVIKHAEYCAANAGVVGLTKAVAIELYSYGITCNAFSPWARTRASYELDTYNEAVPEEDSPFLRKLPAMPGGRAMADITPGPEYIAPFVCYLATDAAKNISGSVFTLGGNTISMYSEPVHSHNLTKYDSKPWTLEEIAQQAPRALFMRYQSIAENPM